MIKETKTIKEVVIRSKYCDVCGVEIHNGMACSVAKCEICGKDLCDKCVEYENSVGDYREVYCKKCWDIGEKYRKKIQEHKDATDKLNEDWLKETKI